MTEAFSAVRPSTSSATNGTLARWSGLALVAAAVLSSGRGFADPAGDKVLAAMDEAMNRPKTVQFDYDVVNQEPNKGEVRLALTVKMKGDKRLTEMVAPADIKGTKVLILGQNQMYVYLPSFGKVRRVSSNVADQGFMGMTFSEVDFGLSMGFGAYYTASVLSETANSHRLLLTPKPGVTAPYAKVELEVTKDHRVPVEIIYFDSNGKKMKTETRTGYTCEANVCTAGEQKMVDHRSGNSTRMIRKSWKLNQPLGDDLFSKRSLER